MERRAGQGRPRLYLSLVLSLVRFYIFFLGMGVEVSFLSFLGAITYFFGDKSGGFLCLPFVFPTGGWGPDYDRLGRYWCQGKGHIYKQLLPVP